MKMNQQLTDEQKRYATIHELRFQKVINLVQSLTSKENPDILDVGPSLLTRKLRKSFPGSTVHTLGIVGEKKDGGHLPKGVLVRENHTEYNLNHCSDKNSWPQPGLFDLVICAEVIEHLHIAPEYVFDFFYSLIRPGGRLIIQTPNAAVLIKRLTLLQGKNPYERIRLNSENPGHFREYTRDELTEIAKNSGFKVKTVAIENYFRLVPKTYKVVIYRFFQNLLGSNWKDGITLVAEKTS